MANTCFTLYACIGDKESIKNLKKALETVRDPENPNDKMPWAGEFLKGLGYDPDEKLDRYGCIHNGKGDIRVNDDGTRLDFSTESKWARCECLEEVIAEKFGVEVYFLEEELGCDIFDTNDMEHVVFPEYIIVDSDDEGMDYYTEDKAREQIKELIDNREEVSFEGLDKMPLDEIPDFLFQNFDDVKMHIAQAA